MTLDGRLFSFCTVRYLLLFLLLYVAPGCAAPPLNSPTPLPSEIRVYGWPDDISPVVLEAFTAEYDITVNYVAFDGYDDAVAALRNGEVFDVVVLSNDYVALLAEEALLAPLEKAALLNFNNISPNFRNLAHDPDNRYSVPFNWGTEGMIVRSDLVTRPIDSWLDLKDIDPSQQIIMWPTPRTAVALALNTLGYSPNTENMDELEEARDLLLAIRPYVTIIEDSDTAVTVNYIVSGDAVVALNTGVREALEAQAQGAEVDWVLPVEGSLLWGDNFTIPANAPHKAAAHLFIDFLLRPESGAHLAEWNQYATPNDAALPLMDPTIVNNPLIYPSFEDLNNAKIVLPVSAETYARTIEIWDEFVAAGQ